MIIPIIILLATLENIWPIIAGYLATPKGYVFLGTIHHPGDYFYYLSQFTQGSSRWFTARDLYTSELVPPTFVGWFNVLLGHLFHLVGVPPIPSYHLAVVLLTILLFTFAYFLARTMLRSYSLSGLALFLFILYHAFPMFDHGVLTYSDYWNNYAVPLVRVGGVPHQLLTAILSFGIVIATIHSSTSKKYQSIRLVALFLMGAALSSLQPVLWLMLTVVIGISAITYGAIKRLHIKQLSIFCFPALFIGLGGIIPALYLSNLFRTEPFVQLRLWELSQNNQLTALHFLLATGPIFLIALFSLPSYLAKPSFATLLNFFFPLFSFSLFLSPIPPLLGVTQVRFMSTLTILCVSIIAADGIGHVSAFLKTKLFYRPSVNRELITFVLLIPLTLLLLPNHVKTLQLSTRFDPGNAYQYLSASDYRFVIQAGAIARNQDDTFLVIWPYNVLFPGITGDKSFNGHQLLTIRAAQKDALAQHVFDESLSSGEMERILIDYRIRYVLAYTWTPKLSELPILTPVIRTGTLVLYRVRK